MVQLMKLLVQQELELSRRDGDAQATGLGDGLVGAAGDLQAAELHALAGPGREPRGEPRGAAAVVLRVLAEEPGLGQQPRCRSDFARSVVAGGKS